MTPECRIQAEFDLIDKLDCIQQLTSIQLTEDDYRIQAVDAFLEGEDGVEMSDQEREHAKNEIIDYLDGTPEFAVADLLRLKGEKGETIYRIGEPTYGLD